MGINPFILEFAIFSHSLRVHSSLTIVGGCHTIIMLSPKNSMKSVIRYLEFEEATSTVITPTEKSTWIPVIYVPNHMSGPTA
jgi:hypothetical protein